MKRFLTYALCVILVLGMIPASIISAFAQGKGVAKDETQNQSIDNAPNQYIPETITVDGNIDDLGWKEWITVDSVSGVWNNATVSDDQKGFSYTYSIRRDHEYLYVAVNFSDNAAHDFNVYYSANDGVNVTTVSFNAENNTVGENQVKLVSNDGIVEFSYALGDAAAAETLSCYVSATFNGNKLFYPAIYPAVDAYSSNAPSTSWNSDKAIKIPATAMKNGNNSDSEHTLPSHVNIDGLLDEGYWAYLTGYHQKEDKINTNDYKSGNYPLLSFDTVKYSNSYSNKNPNGQTIRFKTDIRMDVNCIYGSAMVFDNLAESSGRKTTGFEVIIMNNSTENLHKFQMVFTEENGTQKTTLTDKTLNKTGFSSTLTKAAMKSQPGNLVHIEFRIDVADLPYLGIAKNGDNDDEITVDVRAWTNDDYQAYYNGISLGNYKDEKYTDLSDELVIDGNIDNAAWKALRGNDNFIDGEHGIAGKGEVKQFSYLVKLDYEYLYGAALIEMTNNQWVGDRFCLYLKDTAGATTYSYRIVVEGKDNNTTCYVWKGGASYPSAAQAMVKAVADTAENASMPELQEERLNDNRYIVEFKVPLSSVGIDLNQQMVDQAATTKTILYYNVSVESGSTTAGVAGPIGGTQSTFDPNALDGYNMGITYADVVPTVLMDGVFSEFFWNEKEDPAYEFEQVDISNSTIADTTPKDLSYKYKLYVGYEYLYGAAQINSDEENVQFAIFINAKPGERTRATHRFVLRKKDGAIEMTGYAYKPNTGGENITGIPLNGYSNEMLHKYLKYNIQTLDGNTYFEFALDLDCLKCHNGTEFEDSFGRTNFEYFVVAEQYQDGNGNPAFKQMLYPAVNDLKGNANAYANVDGAWNETLKANAIENIEKLQHIAPEVIYIDGHLDDNGWDPNGWIEVSAKVNGTVQGGSDDTYIVQGNEPFTYKYQLRHDGEYLYVAALFDMPYEYSVASSTATEPGGTKPEFRIWINPKDENGNLHETFQYLYDVTAGSGVTGIKLPENSGTWSNESDYSYKPYDNMTPAQQKKYYFENEKPVKPEGIITYPNSVVVRAAQNKEPDYPNGGDVHPATGETMVYDLLYGESEFYGYTDIVQENENYGTTGEDWYADVKNESYTIGNQHAIICSGVDKRLNSGLTRSTNGANYNAIVEFKVRMSEFDPEGYGFEYSINAVMQGYYSTDKALETSKTYNNSGKLSTIDYTLHHPAKYNEPGSTNNYWGINFPYWRWYNGIDFADIEDSTRLRNNTTPVVSLGAKICENYIAPDNGEETGAIRFGARYEEKYIRYLAGMDDADYWDVKDMGIVILPAYMLENLDDLTIETPNAAYYPADNIVGWQKRADEATDGWSNFADYKNFVFYVTLWGIDANDENYANMDFAFRGYMTFYEGVYDDGNIGGYVDKDFYGDVLVRNYNEVETVAKLSEKGETDESKPVLPDGDYDGSQPPVEVPPSKEN